MVERYGVQALGRPSDNDELDTSGMTDTLIVKPLGGILESVDAE